MNYTLVVRILYDLAVVPQVEIRKLESATKRTSDRESYESCGNLRD